jgi:hypothetical protein
MDYPKKAHGLAIWHPIVWGALAAVMIVLVAVLAAIERRTSGVAEDESDVVAAT